MSDLVFGIVLGVCASYAAIAIYAKYLRHKGEDEINAIIAEMNKEEGNV